MDSKGPMGLVYRYVQCYAKKIVNVWPVVIVYNCKSDTMSPTKEDDIVMSVTTFPDKHITFAVMYGCTNSMMKNAVSSLEGFRTESNLYIFHPLILPMVFAELERKRLLNVLERKSSELSQRILDVENGLKQDEQSTERSEHSRVTLAERDCETTRLWISVSKLKNGLKSLKTQLSSMRAHCNCLSQPALQDQVGKTREYRTEPESGERMQARMQEIMDEFDTKIGQCDSVLGGTSLAAQIVSLLKSWMRKGLQ